MTPLALLPFAPAAVLALALALGNGGLLALEWAARFPPFDALPGAEGTE